MSAIAQEAGPLATVHTDSGLFSETAVQQIDQTRAGTTVFMPLDKTSHHRGVADFEMKSDPAPPAEALDPLSAASLFATLQRSALQIAACPARPARAPET